MRTIERILFLAFVMMWPNLAAAQTISRDQVLSKPAASLHPQWVKEFQNNYSREDLDAIGRGHVIGASVFAKFREDLFAKIPELAAIDADIVDQLILRFDLAFQLSKNGYETAGSSEFAFALGIAGEFVEAVEKSVPDRARSEKIIAETMTLAFDGAVERTARMRKIEKERFEKAHSDFLAQLKNPAGIYQTGRAWRGDLVNSNASRGYIISFVTIIAAVGASSIIEYAWLSDWIPFALELALKSGVIYTAFGLEAYNLYYRIKRHKLLLRPWKRLGEIRAGTCRQLLGAD